MATKKKIAKVILINGDSWVACLQEDYAHHLWMLYCH